MEIFSAPLCRRIANHLIGNRRKKSNWITSVKLGIGWGCGNHHTAATQPHNPALRVWHAETLL
jgi:hypothetical protein